MYEVDTDGDGAVSVNGTDANNSTLGLRLQAATLCANYVAVKTFQQNEKSPWAKTPGNLWVSGVGVSGKIACSQVTSTRIDVLAFDSDGLPLHAKALYAD
jgi:hypothetical protein